MTIIAGEGKETQSRPAVAGDMVVRNRSDVTGNEEYLVSADTFVERYEGPLAAPDAGGWSAYRPRGGDLLYVILRDRGRRLLLHRTLGRGDGGAAGRRHRTAIPHDPRDTYRVAAAAFTSSYEVIEAPKAQ